jgi:hypothetical protein
MKPALNILHFPAWKNAGANMFLGSSTLDVVDLSSLLALPGNNHKKHKQNERKFAVESDAVLYSTMLF